MGCTRRQRLTRFVSQGVNMKENRHFYEPRVNLTIHFYTWFPPSAPRGSGFPSAPDFLQRCTNSSAWAAALGVWENSWDWQCVCRCRGSERRGARSHVAGRR